MSVPKPKDELARKLADEHAEEESIVKIIRLRSEKESDPNEPIKLLEVSTTTPTTGIIPVLLPASGFFPYATIVVEVTKDEFSEIQQDRLRLPDNWQRTDILIDKE